MRWIVFLCGVFLSISHALETKQMYLKEPIFKASVFVTTMGDETKPALVLVHGLGDEASAIWQNSLEAFVKEYFVIILDLPGFGESSKSNELYSPENYAKSLHFIMQQILNRPFHLLGHSMGGAIVLQYTYLYPHDVESLILVDVAGILHKFAYGNFIMHHKINHFFAESNILLKKLQTPSFNHFIDRVLDKVDSKMTVNMDQVLVSKELREVIFGGSPHVIAAVALIQTNFNKILPEILTKTTIIWGDEDAIAPIQTAYVLKKILKNSQLNFIRGAGHIPMVTHEQEFVQDVLSHLNRLDSIVESSSLDYVKNAPKQDIKIKNVTNKIFSGHMGTMLISDSQDIVIQNASIEKLVLVNSSVEIINSVLENNRDTVVILSHSKLSIIASDVIGSIQLDNAHLNLAGVMMSSIGQPFFSIHKSVVLFSLCKINDKLMHNQQVLGK